MKLVEIGHITKPHGVGGEVKIRLHWQGSDALSLAEEVFVGIRGQSRKLKLESLRGSAKVGLIARFGEIQTRDAAESLRGASVSIPRDQLPPLEPGEYYLCDLVGARVIGPDGAIGEVVEVSVHPSVDALVIRTEQGTLVEQPIDDAWIARVDVEAGVVELSTTAGLV